ncbi:response regulator transcription factor [Lactobacillus sp. DCY120]|uniref:Response regulator transcription factor n=1 Tax=Bombilactobacillus apium TaxID=2675299 RepID=A0A850QZQ8_9LACO|nr:LytTR family DNA-binding domain-containing protein [Bombilactobacillus apium]NVY96173.1 response regulator transcription factor [Bombilactobacillus apium]
MFTVCICDDDASSLIYTRKMLLRASVQFNIDFKIKEFKSAKSFIDFANHEKESLLIIYMDIEIGDINGIEVISKVKSILHIEPIVYFISNYPEYVFDSFRVHPQNYLVKPVDFKKIKQTITDVNKKISNHDKQMIIILDKNTGNKRLTLINDIIYLELVNSPQRLIKVQTITDHFYTSGRLNRSYEELEKYNFIKIYRSIIININKIESISTNKVIVSNGDILPIGRTQKKQVKKAFIDLINQEFKNESF